MSPTPLEANMDIEQIDAKREEVAKLRPLVKRMIVQQALAEVMRERVDAIKQEILDAEVWMSEPVEGNDRRDGIPAKRITEPKADWLMSEEDHKRYFALLDARVRAEVPGAADLEEGFCPALVEENKLCKLRTELVKRSAPIFGIEVMNSKLAWNLELRDKWIKTVAQGALAA